MIRAYGGLLCVIIAGTALSVTAPSAQAKDPPVLANSPVNQAAQQGLNALTLREAQQMLATFPNSSYNHKTHIDAQQGICEVDCSGFVATVLGKVSPGHLEAIPKPTRRKRPLAEDFYAAFVKAASGELPGWQAVSIENAQPADVLAWWKPEHQKGENTGHVMFIAEKPVAERAGQWRVRILDSTMSPHANDTRPQGKTGLGSGTIWLDTNAAGQILGYHWKSPRGKLNEFPVAIGRVVAF
jgi:hypothetical protein